VFNTKNLYDQLLDELKVKRPVYTRLVREFSEMSLEEYISTFRTCSNITEQENVIQSKSDFVNISSLYAQKLYGTQTADKLKKRLENFDCIFTANHTSANLDHISMQGTIAFALGEKNEDVIPNYTFGNVSLNNSTFPRGLITGDGVRIPIFPDSLKNSMVYCTAPFKYSDLVKLLNKAEKLLQNRKLSHKKYQVILKVINEIYNNEEILNLDSCSEQLNVINSKLWQLLFQNCTDGYRLSDTVNLEIEPIAVELIEQDLNNYSSLLYKILFDTELRENLLNKLSGKYGCWDVRKLNELNYSLSELDHILSEPEKKLKYKEDRARLKGGCGTVFFWGIDSKGRRVPLILASENGTLFLTGITDSKDKFTIKYDSDSIINALKRKKLLPGLFTVFLEIAFVRNLACCGGFMQVDYLTVMRDMLSEALLETGHNRWGKIIKKIKTDYLCTGFEFIFNKADDGNYFPSGTFEILEKNGFDDIAIEKIKKVTVREANLFGMNYIYNAVFRYNEQKEHLKNLDIISIFSDELKKTLIL